MIVTALWPTRWSKRSCFYSHGELPIFETKMHECGSVVSIRGIRDGTLRVRDTPQDEEFVLEMREGGGGGLYVAAVQ